MAAHPAASMVLRRDPLTGLECCPTLEEAARLTPAELEAVHAYLDEQLSTYLEQHAAPEGTEHSAAVGEVQDRLKGHFGRVGRDVFIAPNLGVHYPGACVFAPDLLAVLDVPLHHRSRWQVDAEGRGVDFVLEVLVDGDKRKDTVDNVELYASLGIPEYLVYSVRERTLQGWWLESPEARRYIRIVPQMGRIPSRTLGLEFAVLGGQLRCWKDGAELPLTSEIVALLGRIVEEKEAVVAELIARASAESERAAAEAERAAALAERASAEAEGRQAALRRSILRTLRLRGLVPTVEERATLETCRDTDRLEGWDARVLEAPSVAALLES